MADGEQLIGWDTVIDQLLAPHDLTAEPQPALRGPRHYRQDLSPRSGIVGSDLLRRGDRRKFSMVGPPGAKVRRSDGPGDTGGRRAHLQPDGGDLGDVDGWLAEDGGLTREAERLARLGGDEELLLRLQLGGYAERDWGPVAEELARYGLGVIRCWIRRRLIFQRVATRTGWGMPSVPEEWLHNDDDVEALAVDTVIAALNYFKVKVLMANRWDPTRGASLATFFIGQCLYQFPNVYQSWAGKERTRRSAETALEDWTGSTAKPGPQERLLRTEELAGALAAVTSDTARRAFLLRDDGYTLAEIALQLGLRNAKAVENLLAHQVRQFRRARGKDAS